MNQPLDRDRSALARIATIATTMIVGCLLAVGASAQPAAPSSGGGDPPTRAARLSDVDGQVWLYSPDGNEWVSVDRNQPLTTGDRIATDNGARAEITLGTTTLRLDAATELAIVRLDDSRYVVRLEGGSVAARVRNPQSLAEFELDTDEGRFRLQAVGRFRFDRFDQTSDVTAYSGSAIFENRNTALPITSGQHAQFWLDAAAVPQYALVAPARDAFASWNDDRDRGEERVAAAPRFVSPEMTGAEDLDRYGQWEQTPEYGAIWVPSGVPAGWAPYSAGHWAWVRPWGWTWVDDARWGFAPFHYGRWVNRRDVWCWAPGTYVARPVYAPALVAWVGGPRSGVSLSIGGGGAPVGWFPLAPHEVYVPSYRSSPRYLRDVNYTHVTNVTTITTIVNNRNGEADRREFANQRFSHAVTYVPADVLTRRQPVGPAAARFRNDPQGRAYAADTRPQQVFAAAPVTAPIAAPRPGGARTPPPPPPIAGGRAPGSFGTGRPGGGRPEAGRPEPGRPDAGRPEQARPEGGRPDPSRPEAGRFEPNRPDVGRGPGGRPEIGRAGERPAVAPGTTAPAINSAPQSVGIGAAPRGGAPSPATMPQAGQPARPAGEPMRPGGDAAGMAPNWPGRRDVAAPIGGPPVSARPGIVEPSTGRPPSRGGPSRDAGAAESGTPQRFMPPSPVQRGGASNEGFGRPGAPSREAPAAAPGANPSAFNPAGGEGGVPRPDRMPPPRSVDRSRATQVERMPPAIRSQEPAAVAPPAVQQRAPEPRAEVPRSAPQAERAPQTQPGGRPENPRQRDERREEKIDRPR